MRISDALESGAWVIERRADLDAVPFVVEGLERFAPPLVRVVRPRAHGEVGDVVADHNRPGTCTFLGDTGCTLPLRPFGCRALVPSDVDGGGCRAVNGRTASPDAQSEEIEAAWAHRDGTLDFALDLLAMNRKLVDDSDRAHTRRDSAHASGSSAHRK